MFLNPYTPREPTNAIPFMFYSLVSKKENETNLNLATNQSHIKHMLKKAVVSNNVNTPSKTIQA
jgi:hypothetical protein